VNDPASIAKRYFEIVADLSSPPDALETLLHRDVRIIERPNAMSPHGAVRDREAAIAGFRAETRLLATQRIDLHEVLVSGHRVAVRATWRGTISEGTERLPAGTQLVAHITGMLTVVDGLIREHETFDCYEPLPGR
jgi:ketosteroid isomerase-like protein